MDCTVLGMGAADEPETMARNVEKWPYCKVFHIFTHGQELKGKGKNRGTVVSKMSVT